MAKATKFGEIRNTDTGETLVQIFGPGADGGALSTGLRVLTHQLKLRYPDAKADGGFFGGTYGYGVSFENEVFLMHPFCWCEKNDGSCLWCIHGDNPQFMPLLNARFGTTEESYYNKETGYYDAPHFWHKSSDFRVRWYKYIGRGDAINKLITGVEWQEILAAALASIGAPPPMEALREYLAADL